MLSLVISEKFVNSISEKDSNFLDLNFIVIFKDYEHDDYILELAFGINSFFILLNILLFSLHLSGISELKAGILLSSLIA